DEAAGDPEFLGEPGVFGAELEGGRRAYRRLEDRPPLASRGGRIGRGLRAAVYEVLDQAGIAVEAEEVMGPDARHEGGSRAELHTRVRVRGLRGARPAGEARERPGKPTGRYDAGELLGQHSRGKLAERAPEEDDLAVVGVG